MKILEGCYYPGCEHDHEDGKKFCGCDHDHVPSRSNPNPPPDPGCGRKATFPDHAVIPKRDAVFEGENREAEIACAQFKAEVEHDEKPSWIKARMETL